MERVIRTTQAVAATDSGGICIDAEIHSPNS